ncbi:hypothetical protein J0A94_03515 [Paraclostridium bifermentans]|uniref:Uncharacterized protein n=2 Tax=Paraclostridium bifermentans TaxID=1490 RepID=A0AA44DJT3_PARBF|nr:hypothetical protein [Paraclostridium bifermentans]MBN8046883.1 hypothetical protein [Paraclostridium bifermentans]NME09045.1 hypothetical protein [Paraclostridium bifermentans]
MSNSLDISYSFGYVYDKSKLIVMYPVGTNTMPKDEYEMEVEVAFLEDGIERAFEESDIIEANETIKPLETFLMKPNKIIPFVSSIKDSETKDELNNLLNDFDKEYEIKINYIKKGYEICDIYDVFQNVVKYIPKENIENLNILKINEKNFDIENFIKTTRDSLDEAIDKEYIPSIMRKSSLTDRLFVKEEKQTLNKENLNKEDILNTLENNSLYVIFGVDSSSYSQGILCANGETITELDCDMGDLEISQVRDFGYIIEKTNGELCFKIANFNDEAANNQKIAQVVDYSGIFKVMMINFVNKFVK